MIMIPCANPKAQYLAGKDAVDAAVRRVLESGSYILGEEVAAFEAEFAAWLAPDREMHAVGVASGTDALHVALRALGIGPGDEVVTTSFTAVGTVAAIELAGATPVLADIDPVTLTLDPASVEHVLTPRTRALIPVHLYGAPADLTGVDGLLALARRHGLRVIEDCAQAHGATHGTIDGGRHVGTFGDIGAFSCYPTKNLGALGDAGIVVTADAALADRMRRLRQYGWDDNRLSGFTGVNSRLDALQAAVLRAKLPGLTAANAERRRIAAAYDEALGASGARETQGPGGTIRAPAARPGDGHVYHLYTIRSAVRDRLKAFLAARGIETRVHYDVPVHLQPAYRGRLAGCNHLPVTERAAREVLSVPMFPGLRDEDIAAVCAALRDFLAASNASSEPSVAAVVTGEG